MVRLLEDMQDEGHPCTAVLVLANDPAAGGLAKAKKLGVAAAVHDHRPYGKDRAAYDAALHDILVQSGTELVCLAGFMRILTPEFVTRWQGKMLNIHPSILPKYKGLHTHARAIAAQDKEHGCSVHLVTPELDDGPILGQSRVNILPDDTEESLAARVLIEEHKLYPRVLREFVASMAI